MTDQEARNADQKEWYIPGEGGDVDEATGPLSTPRLIEMIKNGQIRLDGFVWGPHLTESRWYRFYELDDFSVFLVQYPRIPVPKRMSRGILSQKSQVQLRLRGKGEYGDQNRYRRFPRAPFSAPVIIHNQENYFHARCLDISEKGVFVRVDRDMDFRVGEEVVLTIRNFPELGTISLHSVIIRSVKREGDHGYGLYFLRVNPQIRRRIAQYVLHELGATEEVSLEAA